MDEIIKPNHNKNNLSSLNSLMDRIKKKQQTSENELRKKRILENLDYWENSITKVKNIEIEKKYLDELYDNLPKRIAYLSSNSNTNLTAGYKLAKSLVKIGIPPSSFSIVSLNDCYLSVRGFGENSGIKKEIFNPDNEVLIIEGVREDRPTDVKDNSKTFMQELLSYMQNNPDVNVIFIGDSLKSIEFATGKTETTAFFKKMNVQVEQGEEAFKTITPTKKKTRFVKW